MIRNCRKKIMFQEVSSAQTTQGTNPAPSSLIDNEPSLFFNDNAMPTHRSWSTKSWRPYRASRWVSRSLFFVGYVVVHTWGLKAVSRPKRGLRMEKERGRLIQFRWKKNGFRISRHVFGWNLELGRDFLSWIFWVTHRDMVWWIFCSKFKYSKVLACARFCWPWAITFVPLFYL